MLGLSHSLKNLRQLLLEPCSEYPYLGRVLLQLTQLQQIDDTPERKPLVIEIVSFSYKKGIPADPTGNGGGYVFDCRSIHNPGKHERYKSLTGLDEPVIRFLEEDGEITTFLQHVYALVDATVARYLERDFTHLSVCFGCTGGQHRSVYAAQHLAEHLRRKFDVQIHLIHREQHLEQILK